MAAVAELDPRAERHNDVGVIEPLPTERAIPDMRGIAPFREFTADATFPLVFNLPAPGVHC